MATINSNYFRYLLAKKVVDFANDSFKIILMADGFVFNPVTHAKYADISASELATAYGYTITTKVLTGVTVVQDNVNNVCNITWNNVTWTAAGGDIGPTTGAIIYDDTVTSPVADPIIFYIDFEGSFTEPNGGIVTIANLKQVI
jgi:hypothetical protein